jgi:hypothetical protein
MMADEEGGNGGKMERIVGVREFAMARAIEAVRDG